MLKDGVRQKLHELLRSGRVYGCIIAMPCSSFSLAQSRSGVALRSISEPRGCATNDLAKLNRITAGNEFLDFTIGVIRTCNDFHIPYVIENLLTSYAWHDHKLKYVLQPAEIVEVHQCAFGARFHKATRLAFGNFNRMADNKG